MNEHLVLSLTDPALNFGHCIHAGLASFYLDSNAELAKAIAVKSWAPTPENDEEVRTPDKLIEVLDQYFSWPHNGFELVIGKDGKPIVEVTAAHPLLTASDPDRIRNLLVQAGYLPEIIYTGIIDLPIKWNGQIAAADHKTTTWLYTPKDKPSYIAQDFWGGFELSKQFKGYRWLLNQTTGDNSGSFVLNTIGVSKKNDRNCFERRDYLWTLSQLEEWRQDVLATVELFLYCKVNNQWPTTGAHYYCNAYRKPCQFQTLCKASPERRGDLLGLYQKSEWNPLEARKKERLKLELKSN